MCVWLGVGYDIWLEAGDMFPFLPLGSGVPDHTLVTVYENIWEEFNVRLLCRLCQNWSTLQCRPTGNIRRMLSYSASRVNSRRRKSWPFTSRKNWQSFSEMCLRGLLSFWRSFHCASLFVTLTALIPIVLLFIS